jgi:uncharacterized protein YpmB
LQKLSVPQHRASQAGKSKVIIVIIITIIIIIIFITTSSSSSSSPHHHQDEQLKNGIMCDAPLPKFDWQSIR